MFALGWIETIPFIVTIRTTPNIYAIVNALHILGLGLLIGSILSADLRVLGVWKPAGWRDAIITGSPIAATGLGIAIVTGLLLFAVRPIHYVGNFPFLLKLGLLTVGLINVAIFHGWLRRKKSVQPGTILRLSSTLSIAIWIAAVFSGRFIAYVY